jgi:hypothetical protein
LILTHYHHCDDPPFQTLSALPDQAALGVIARLSDRTGAVYDRFRHPQRYLQQRRATEAWLRQEFIRKGGQPRTQYPQYFVVGQATWIESGFDGQSCAIKMPRSAFRADQISFTYPDSMISDWLRTQTDERFYHPEYHGQVFTLSEIRQIIDQFCLPGEAWRTDKTRKYDLFIEAQVWGDLPMPSAGGTAKVSLV